MESSCVRDPAPATRVPDLNDRKVDTSATLDVTRVRATAESHPEPGACCHLAMSVCVLSPFVHSGG